MPIPARGERAADFVLPDLDGRPVRLYGIAGGRPVALAFCDSAEATASLSAAVGSDAQLVAVVSKTEERPAPPWPVFVDAGGDVRALYRIGGDPVAVLLDPNLRVLESLPLVDAVARAKDVFVAAQLDIAAIEIVTQAPVLLLRDALPSAMCRELIEVFETRGNVETGVEHTEYGKRADALDETQKRRRDHTVVDAELLRALTIAVGRRVMSEVQKAFAFRATRFEGFKIACYEEGGLFRPHRDNMSPSTAHRRFALTLNLNDGYEGGHLRFPEYGPHLYRPPAAGALVFSGSHLHEALPVTRGRRFVLLSFLYGEEDLRAPVKA